MTLNFKNITHAADFGGAFMQVTEGNKAAVQTANCDVISAQTANCDVISAQTVNCDVISARIAKKKTIAQTNNKEALW